MEVDLKQGPSAVGEFLVSQRCREICFDRADMAKLLYQARVAKRSGALARTAHAHTEIGGMKHDRWIGVLSVHGGIVYEASHEFGHAQALGKGIEGPRRFIPGLHDLNFVLAELGSW